MRRRFVIRNQHKQTKQETQKMFVQPTLLSFAASNWTWCICAADSWTRLAQPLSVRQTLSHLCCRILCTDRRRALLYKLESCFSITAQKRHKIPISQNLVYLAWRGCVAAPWIGRCFRNLSKWMVQARGNLIYLAWRGCVAEPMRSSSPMQKTLQKLAVLRWFLPTNAARKSKKKVHKSLVLKDLCTTTTCSPRGGRQRAPKKKHDSTPAASTFLRMA